ncbi:O-antigen ligase family protein [Thermoflavimicrobium dichotomicum]|uniref:O-Antigen ligase n=1 Tax=Thermoflavimicrobium dichotomicum TaxID=46223 RepID=A0A1I3JXQ2_9BACL|nr:O-antigen ligase family protein [Thermoflavimicrobium dichotomicum]SFI64725.1 O-Antigen ligase [Thermoflavimicrobium dichotomicum]
MIEKIFSQKRLELIFYFMIAFALLGPTLGIDLHPEFKLTFFRIAFFVLLAFLIIRFLKYKDLEASHLYPIRWYIAFFAFWFIYAVISLAWVIQIKFGIRYVFFLFMMILLCLAFPYFARDEKRIWRSLGVAFAVFSIMVYFGLFESVTYFHLPSSRYWGSKSASVTSFFQNQNDFATTITLALPFLATALHTLNLRRKMKVFLYFTIIFALYCLLATGSRSNTFFALPLIFVVWVIALPFTVPKEKLTKNNIFKGVAVVLSIALIVGLLSQFLLAENGRAKLASTIGIFQDLKSGTMNIHELDEVEKGEGTGGQSITVRKYLLLYGLDFLQKSHYLGVGAGNVEAHMKGKKGVNKVNIHNWWAEVLVNFGVIVFVLYMALYLWLLYQLWLLAQIKKSPSISPVIRWGAIASLLSLIGFFFGAIAPSSCIHFTPMWSTIGIALAIVAIGNKQKQKA